MSQTIVLTSTEERHGNIPVNLTIERAGSDTIKVSLAAHTRIFNYEELKRAILKLE
jgi:hypothetical protein